MGGLWRLYYGGTFGQRLGGKYGPLVVLMAILAVNLWFASDNPWTTLLAVPMALLWVQGFNDWSRWGTMLIRYTMYTVPIALIWSILEAAGTGDMLDTSKLWYALVGLSGLAYPILNRIQPTPLLGYTQWAEVITGIAMVDSVLLLAWLT